MAAGASSATAAGEKVPSDVSAAAIRKNTQGSSIVLPLTRRTQVWTMMSMVPFRWAMLKKYVTPMIVTTMLAGNSSRICLSVIPSMK